MGWLGPKAVGRTIVPAGCVVAVLASAASAGARLTPIVPPSNGAGNVYLETLPGPSGSQSLNSGGSQSTGPAETPSNGSRANGAQPSPIGSSELQTLAKREEAGRVVRGLAPQSHPRVALSAPATKAQSPAGSVGKLIVGNGRSGLGLALPLILGAAVVAAIAFALRRRAG
jgi:hypothetical protein